MHTVKEGQNRKKSCAEKKKKAKNREERKDYIDRKGKPVYRQERNKITDRKRGQYRQELKDSTDR